MAELSPSDLAALVTKLTASVEALQSRLDEFEQRSADSSSSGHRGSHTGEHHHDRPPRFQKLDFPKFDGKSDPLAFINRCESYFHQQRIAEEEKVWMASYNLEAGAQLWFMQIQCDEGTPQWRRFTELLHTRFGPPLRSNPLGELVACRRTGSVVEYQDRFEALLPRAGALTEVQKVQLFTAGLQPPLSLDIEILNPQSLAVAISLARKLELRELCAGTPTPPPRHQGQRGLLPVPPPRPPLPAAAPPAPAPQPGATAEGRQVRRLSQAKMEERRRLGLCFNCNEKFGRGHNRVCQQIFLIDLALDDDDGDAEDVEQAADEPRISMHAITGIRTSETMQVRIHLGGASLLALLDLGSTHNFVAAEVVARTSLQLRPGGKLQVMVANGDQVPCPGAYRGVAFSIGGESFLGDFFSLALAGYDVVLGTQWLASLGPILWDFGARTMSF
jgi:hypothetical protein